MKVRPCYIYGAYAVATPMHVKAYKKIRNMYMLGRLYTLKLTRTIT